MKEDWRVQGQGSLGLGRVGVRVVREHPDFKKIRFQGEVEWGCPQTDTEKLTFCCTRGDVFTWEQKLSEKDLFLLCLALLPIFRGVFAYDSRKTISNQKTDRLMFAGRVDDLDLLEAPVRQLEHVVAPGPVLQHLWVKVKVNVTGQGF